MAINITRWTPDTCGCTIDFAWDDSVPAEQRVHTAQDVIKICPDHSGMQGKKHDHYAVLLSENRGKNKIHGKLLDNSSMSDVILDDDGNIQRKFKRGCGFDYTFEGKDDKRVIKVTTKGYKLAPAEIADILTLVDPSKTEIA